MRNESSSMSCGVGLWAKKKRPQVVLGSFFSIKGLPAEVRVLVGMTGFEPATTRPPDEYSTGLSYIPKTRVKLSFISHMHNYCRLYLAKSFPVWHTLCTIAVKLNIMKKLTVLVSVGLLFIGSSVMAQSSTDNRDEKKVQMKEQYDNKGDAQKAVQNRRAKNAGTKVQQKERMQENFDSKDEAKEAVQERKENQERKQEVNAEKKQEMKVRAQESGKSKSQVQQKAQAKKKKDQ